MNRTKLISIVSAVIMLLLGLFILINPGQTMTLLVRIIGAFFAVTGLIGISSKIVSKDFSFSGSSAIVGSTLSLVAGLVLIANPGFILGIINLIMGVIILVYGIMNLLSSIDMGKNMGALATAPVIMSAITILLGLIVIFAPLGDLLMMVVGAVIIYNAVVSLYIALKK